MTGTEYLQQLNEDQKEAVQSDSRSLQILAGPGSGKTRVLTTRVAWLVKEKDVRPSSIVVVTFTNKAAKEMKERLEQPTLLGFKRSAYLHMGTFHSFCAGILRRHIDLTPLERNFVIADAAKSKQLLTDIVKELEPHLQNKTGVKTQTASEYHLYISKAKSAGIDHHTYMAENRGHFLKKYTAMVYTAYEERLEAENMIDFDGLLLQGRNLLRDHPQVTDFVEHVLVDEFQDTNALQYELLQLLTRHGEKAFTVVGDPDQSIFGWRDADKAHFGKMEADYKDTVIVDLKENYRSTKFILQSASHVVEKDKARRPRHLFTNNHEGAPISLMKLETEVDEANAVAMEIKRILKYSNGLIGYKDIAVMFRMNFLTRNFEKAFTQAKIPYVLVSGTRFLDRMEVKDVLSYLSFFYNSRDSVAFTRLINAPKRGLGDVSIKKILICSRENGWTLLETLQRILDKHPATSHIRLLAKAREELNNLLKLQTEIQNKLNQKASIDIVLKHIVESISYFDYLKSNFEKDYESREANVKELIVFAQQHCEDLVDESDTDMIGSFLEATSLCGDTKEHDETKEGRVSLITMHAAKGLEWTCAFVAGCEEGIIPMSSTTDTEEESRVLYVAMTRAKCFLYMTHAAMRRRWDDYDKPLISRFLYDLPTSSYQKSTPVWNATIRQWVATVLRKHYVEEKTLRLEDGGKTFESQDDSESALDQPSTQTSLLDVKTHGIIPSFASAINLLSSEHQLHQHQPHQRQKEKQYSISKNTPHSSFSFSRPTLTISTSISIPKPYNSPSTTLSKYQDQLTNGIGHKQQRNNTTTSSHHLIKNESPNMHESLTTKLGQKRNMNYFDGIQQSGKTNKINKKRTIESSEFNIEQIVTKAIQGVAVGKNSFSLDEVVIKAQKENIENDQAVTIQNQVIKQLDNLVKTGALWKTKKNGSIRFLVAE